MDGWIKIHRKILDNPIVCKDSDHFAVWNYLLLHASHKEVPILFKGKKTMLLPGQLITGRGKIADTFKISDSKVKRILIAFESDQQIERQRSNQNSLITIRNWSSYQCESDQQNDQPMTSQRPASDQPVTTNKNIKNIRTKDIKESNTSITKEKAKRFIPPTLEEVESYCLERRNGIDAQRFISHYETSKWYRGKTKIADWKACVRTWERRGKDKVEKGDFSQREYTDEQLKGVLVDFDKWEVEK